MQILAMIWAALNSPAGVTAMGGLLLYGLNALYARKPLWQKFEGTIIAGIKLAEKNIPDDTPNKGLAKLDNAMKFIINVYEESYGRLPSDKEIIKLRESVSIMHNTLDAAGTLKKKQ